MKPYLNSSRCFVIDSCHAYHTLFAVNCGKVSESTYGREDNGEFENPVWDRCDNVVKVGFRSINGSVGGSRLVSHHVAAF